MTADMIWFLIAFFIIGLLLIRVAAAMINSKIAAIQSMIPGGKDNKPPTMNEVIAMGAKMLMPAVTKWIESKILAGVTKK